MDDGTGSGQLKGPISQKDYEALGRGAREAALAAERDALAQRVEALEEAAGKAGMVLFKWGLAGDDEKRLWSAIEERDYVLFSLYPKLGVDIRTVFDEEGGEQ